jgi:hypothetical protein
MTNLKISVLIQRFLKCSSQNIRHIKELPLLRQAGAGRRNEFVKGSEPFGIHRSSPYQWLRSLLEQVSLSTSLTHMYRSGAVLPSTGRGQERIMKKVPAFESFCGCAGMGSSLTTEFRFREPLIKSKNKLSCHSGESRKPVKQLFTGCRFSTA